MGGQSSGGLLEGSLLELCKRESMMVDMRSFLEKDEGQDTVEYGLLAAFISIFALIAIKAIGPLVNTLYENVKKAFAP